MELNIRIGGLKFGSGVTRLCDLVCTYSAKSTYICIINEFKRYSPHVFYKAKAQTYMIQTYCFPISQLCPATCLSLPSLRKARRIFYLNHHQPRVFDMSLSLCIAVSSKLVCFTC